MEDEFRTKFWKKLEDNDRKFRWFFEKYVRKLGINRAYTTLIQQAKGDNIVSIHPKLETAMKQYIEEK